MGLSKRGADSLKLNSGAFGTPVYLAEANAQYTNGPRQVGQAAGQGGAAGAAGRIAQAAGLGEICRGAMVTLHCSLENQAKSGSNPLLASGDSYIKHS